MPRPPVEGKFKYIYHKTPESGDAAWDRFYEDGDLTGMISVLPGPHTWSEEELSECCNEYAWILRRLVARFKQCQNYQIALRIEQLASEGHSQEEIGRIVSRELNIDPSLNQYQVSRIRARWARGWKDWISGTSQSVTNFRNKPPWDHAD